MSISKPRNPVNVPWGARGPDISEMATLVHLPKSTQPPDELIFAEQLPDRNEHRYIAG